MQLFLTTSLRSQNASLLLRTTRDINDRQSHLPARSCLGEAAIEFTKIELQTLGEATQLRICLWWYVGRFFGDAAHRESRIASQDGTTASATKQ